MMTSIIGNAMNFMQNVYNLLFPSCCLYCGNKAEVSHALCRNCYSVYIKESFEHCPKCGNTVKNCSCGCDFTSLTRTSIGDRQFISLCFYISRSNSTEAEQRQTENMILRFKQRGEFTDFFANELASELRKQFSKAKLELSEWILTYPPRNADNLEKFGFDQCEEMVKKLSSILDIPYRKTIYRISGDEQKNLNMAERLENAENSLAIIKDSVHEGDKFILFDDIITSGATISTSTRNLYFNGARAVFPISIARTMHPK